MPQKIELDHIDLAQLEQAQNKAACSRKRGGVWNEFGDVTGKKLVGRILKFEVPFKNSDIWWIYKDRCFGDLNKQIVNFQFAHNSATKAASTTDHLTILNDGRFELDLEAIDRGPFIASLAESGVAASISVGVDSIDHDWEYVGDEKVAVVRKARLVEISQLTEGAAGENAWCAVVDKDTFPELIDGVECEQFNLLHDLHKIAWKAKEIKRKVDEANPQRPISNITLDDVNRWQTCESERLQDLASSRVNGW
jgi:hypothetical protein